MTPSADYIDAFVTALLRVQVTGTAQDVHEGMTRCVEILTTMHEAGGEVHLIGNGGSAAIVAHAQNDFVKGAGIRARLCQDVPLLTAYANDLGYDATLDPMALWMKPTDVLIAVSSSGESENILSAVRAAKKRHLVIVTLTGFRPTNMLRRMGDLNFYVPSAHYGSVELAHATLLHCLTDALAV